MNTSLKVNSMDAPAFYRAFEDRHRGSRELIKQRLRQYIPYLVPLAGVYPQGHTLDLGCGRGEWLEVASELGFTARGVDLDAGMLAACSELGLDVSQQDLIEALQACADESLCVISAFHVVEHISFETLQALLREALRVLVPGGLLILETPNPENLVVGTNNFYLDPTHIRPIPSLLLESCAEFAGFHHVKTLRLQENPSLHGAEHIHLIDVLSGASPDYAVISQKHANGEVLDRFNEAFQKDFGLSLGQLANRHDTFAQRQLDETKIHLEQTQSQIHAELVAKHAELKHQIAQEYALAVRLTALLSEQQATAAQQAEHLQAQIAKAQQRHEAHEAQQQNALADLHKQLDTQRTQAQTREDELRQHAAQQAEHLQAQIAQAQQRHEAHEGQQQNALADLRQQLDIQRTQAQAHEDEIRQHAAQQLQALQAQMNAQIVAMLESIQQQTAYAQGLAEHIDAMRSTWWWRFSMLWRSPSKWRLLPAPLLTHPFNMPHGGTLFATANPNPSAAPPRGETPNSPEPTANAKQPNPVFSQALPIMRLAMPIQHITELFALDGHVLITEVYRSLLKREPDEHGMAYYLGRLAQGYGKAAVIAQMAQSPECRPLDEIKGLKKLVAEERRAHHWFWGRFGHRNRVERILQSGLLPVARIEQQLQALQEAILLQGQQIGDLATQAASNRQIPLDDAPRLPSETVRQCFVDILGREPESEDVIKNHARLPSREALQETLINSEEFKKKVSALPELARSIFMRQIKQVDSSVQRDGDIKITSQLTKLLRDIPWENNADDVSDRVKNIYFQIKKTATTIN